MQKPVIPVMHCFDNNYVIPAAVAFLSMLEHASPKYEYILYVLHTDITPENQQNLQEIVARFANAKLQFINMANKFQDVFAKLGTQNHYSKEVLYKLLVPSIFPQHDRILIADVDVVYMGDILQSWELSLENDEAYIAAVKPVVRRGHFSERDFDQYRKNFTEEEISRLECCGGYFIFNLKQLRENNVEQQFIDTLKKEAPRLLMAEQDVINLVIPKEKRMFLPLNSLVCSYAYDIYADGAYDLDKNYSAEQIADAFEHPIQLHYASPIKPWNNPEYCTKAEIWYNYLGKTKFFHIHMKNMQRGRYTLFGIPVLRLHKNHARLFGFIKLKKKR